MWDPVESLLDLAPYGLAVFESSSRLVSARGIVWVLMPL